MSTLRHQTCSRRCTQREENHLAGSAEEVNCTRDQSLRAANHWNSRKCGIPFALQLAREHIMPHVVTVILRLGEVLQKDLDVMPRALYRVGVGPRVWIDEAEAMVNGAVRLTLSRSRYALQHSLMTVVPSSIHSRISAVSVSAILTGTGTRNVLPVPCSTPPNTH